MKSVDPLKQLLLIISVLLICFAACMLWMTRAAGPVYEKDKTDEGRLRQICLFVMGDIEGTCSWEQSSVNNKVVYCPLGENQQHWCYKPDGTVQDSNVWAEEVCPTEPECYGTCYKVLTRMPRDGQTISSMRCVGSSWVAPNYHLLVCNNAATGGEGVE